MSNASLTQPPSESDEQAMRRGTAPIALLAALLPAGIMLALVSCYGVNVPFWDEWSLVSLFEKAHAHTLSVADLFAQNNEHRLMFPKLLFLGLGYFTRWNPRIEMFVSVFFCTLTSACLQWLFWRTLHLSRSMGVILAFVTSLLLFSPCQHENWLWGYQLSCFLLNLCLVGGVAVLCSGLPKRSKFFLAAGCALVATFSGGNGITLWPLLLLTFLLRDEKDNRRGVQRWTGAWITVALCAIALYYFHYQKPPWHPSLAASHNWLDYFCYLTAFIGSPLGRHADTASLTMPISVGLVETGLFAFFVTILIWRRDIILLRNAAPWIAIGGYTLLTGLMVCITRIGFGPTQSLQSRYTTFTLLLSVSLIPLSLVARCAMEAKKGLLMGAVNAALFTGMIVFFAESLPFGFKMMSISGERRAAGHVALTFLNCFPQKQVLETTIHPNLPLLTNFARRADALHLLHPRLFEPAELHRLLIKSDDVVDACGTLESIDRTAEDKYVARGWAVLPDPQRCADAVVLAYRNADNITPFTLALDHVNRPGIAKFYRGRRMLNPGWKGIFPRELINTPTPAEIEAWAFNVETVKLCKLRGSCPVY